MTAGLATLRTLATEDGWTRLAELGRYFGQTLAAALSASAMPSALASLSSMFWFALHATEPPRAAERIDARAAPEYARLFHALLAKGIALAPSAYEIGFLSLAHSRVDVDRLAAALGEALSDPAVSRLA
jgi:glutamate-1-semialdehyde 2,1-aminomutase